MISIPIFFFSSFFFLTNLEFICIYLFLLLIKGLHNLTHALHCAVALRVNIQFILQVWILLINCKK